MEFVALISGGKDSFFSLLHCLNNGHKLAALANLHPPSLSPDDSEEIDSFMYQTVGCGVIPLYSSILKVPLYRKPVLGKSLNTDLAYSPSSSDSGGGDDETEDLYELLKLVLEKHPGVKAVSSGAILSTYQRTRVESVCGRLGLTSLSWLWMRSQRKLLEEMSDAGLDARIIKVASLGLDENFLGKTVTDYSTRLKLEDVRRKWGGNVAGEGGEFETLVFGCKGWPARIEVTDSKVVHEEGDVKWLRISGCKLVEEEQGSQMGPIKKPELLEQAFQEILEAYKEPSTVNEASFDDSVAKTTAIPPLSITKKTNGTYHVANVTAMNESSSTSSETITNDPAAELAIILSKLSNILTSLSACTRNVTSSLLLIRSMSTFVSINQIYKPFFSSFPNPPSRVCVAIGDCMPPNTNVILTVAVDVPPPQSSTASSRKALHVQSRSYWAPANVGPYSQAVSIDGLVSVAGMIGLTPETMSIYNNNQKGVIGEAVLALQNMVRVGREVGVHGKTGWAGGVAYVRKAEDVDAAEYAWNTWFKPPQQPIYKEGDEEDDADDQGEELQEIKEFENNDSDVKSPSLSREMTEIQLLPPPLLTVCVEDLPVNARVEYASIGVDGAYLHDLIRRIEEDEDNEDTLYLKRESVTLHRSISSTQQTVYFGSHELCWGTLSPEIGTNPTYIADELGDKFIKAGSEIVGMTLFVPPMLPQGMAEIVEELGGKDFQIDGVAVVPVKGVYYREPGGGAEEGVWRQDVIGFMVRWQRKSY